MYRIFLAASLCLLSACGGGSSDNSTDTSETQNTTPVERNVALNNNGASVSASYDQSGAQYVIDGDASTDTYWAAQTQNDQFVIDFGGVRSVSEITIYTNDLSFSSASPNKVVAISSDNTTWQTTADILGGDIPCLNSTAGQGKIHCELTTPTDAQFLRMTITAQSSPYLIQIYEVEVTGL